jgi:cation transport ATPase
MVRRLLAVGCLVVVAAGAILHLAGAPAAGDLVLALGSVLVLVPLTWSVARSLAHRDVGVDAIALLAIAGALALGQWGAAAVVALMLAGGNALEEAAAGRARRELRALVERAPRVAHRIGPGGSVEELPVDRVMIGDSLVVRAGEIVPVDGVLTGAEALVDESTRSAAAPATPATSSSFVPSALRPRARTRQSSASCRRRSRASHDSSAWPTAMRSSSFP